MRGGECRGERFAMMRDPVCDQEVDEVQARLADLTVRYAKRMYSFCSPQCKHEFESCPGEYVAQPGSGPGAGNLDGYVEVVRRRSR